MQMPFDQYATYLFDCDGVLLDSNPIKSRAFYLLAEPFGGAVAEKLVAYHKAHGGVSRFAKVAYLLKELVNDYSDEKHKHLVEKYGELTRSELARCPLTDGCREFLEYLPVESKKYVVSGGLEKDVVETLRAKDLDRFFNCICGSPKTKFDHVEELLGEGLINKPALFFGDARVDIEVAERFGFDSVFLKKYTEFSGWQNFLAGKSTTVVSTFRHFLRPT